MNVWGPTKTDHLGQNFSCFELSNVKLRSVQNSFLNLFKPNFFTNLFVFCIWLNSFQERKCIVSYNFEVKSILSFWHTLGHIHTQTHTSTRLLSMQVTCHNVKWLPRGKYKWCLGLGYGFIFYRPLSPFIAFHYFRPLPLILLVSFS